MRLLSDRADFARVSTSPRLARAATAARACFALGSVCASRAASSARTDDLSGADTGSSRVTVIVSTFHPSTTRTAKSDGKRRQKEGKPDARHLLADFFHILGRKGWRSH